MWTIPGSGVVDGGSLESQLEHASRIALDLVQLEPRAKRLLVDRMVELKNRSWLGEGESSVNADEFLARITLARIHLLDEGEASLIFDDGDLFCGHYLTVDLLPTGVLENASMFG